MHTWGDGFDFDTLYEIEQEIRQRLYRRTFCTLVSKEKWGCIVYEMVLPPGSQYRVTNRFQRAWMNSRLYRAYARYGFRQLHKICLTMSKKYPIFGEEILEDIEWRLEYES